MYELLTAINDPRELRQLERSQLARLADELRRFLLESVSQTGGHLSSNLGTVELTVENTGPVVPAHEVPGLFEPFRRLASTERLAGAARGASIRGAGLGLSIVRSVAVAHGGEVQATSREGGGLIVHVRIPASS